MVPRGWIPNILGHPLTFAVFKQSLPISFLISTAEYEQVCELLIYCSPPPRLRARVPGGSWCSVGWNPLEWRVVWSREGKSSHPPPRIPTAATAQTRLSPHSSPAGSLTDEMISLPLIISASQPGTQRWRMWRIRVNNSGEDWNPKTGKETEAECVIHSGSWKWDKLLVGMVFRFICSAAGISSVSMLFTWRKQDKRQWHLHKPCNEYCTLNPSISQLLIRQYVTWDVTLNFSVQFSSLQFSCCNC